MTGRAAPLLFVERPRQMSSSKAAARHPHSPPLNTFSRLAAFFSSHRHTSPSPSPKDIDWIPYRPPPSPSPTPGPEFPSTSVASPLTQYLFTPNPFGRSSSPSHSDQVPTPNKPLLQQQQPVLKSTFSSSSGHSLLPQQTYSAHPYPVSDAPALNADPFASLKGKGKAVSKSSATFTFPSVQAPGSSQAGPNSHQTFIALDAASGGIGESPQAIVKPTAGEKKSGGSKGGGHYAPFSQHHPNESNIANVDHFHRASSSNTPIHSPVRSNRGSSAFMVVASSR